MFSQITGFMPLLSDHGLVQLFHLPLKAIPFAFYITSHQPQSPYVSRKTPIWAMRTKHRSAASILCWQLSMITQQIM